MKSIYKYLILGLALVVFSVGAHSSQVGYESCVVEKVVTEVYVCKGPYSKKFHSSSSCRGLSNCSTDIGKYSSQQAAKDAGYDYCKICWK